MALAERVDLVTGAARGIGRATAELFRAEGWHVVAVDIKHCASGNRCMRADLSDPAAASGVIKSIADNEARLDALVNNAAVQICKPLDETTLAEWDKIMACNLRTPFWLMRETLPLLEAQRGAIVNVSSVHAIATSTEIGAYAASKGGSPRSPAPPPSSLRPAASASTPSCPAPSTPQCSAPVSSATTSPPVATTRSPPSAPCTPCAASPAPTRSPRRSCISPTTSAARTSPGTATSSTAA